MVNLGQYNTIQNILSVFETGKVPSPAAYGTCSVLKDGAGISYGLHQSTDRSGSLDAIVQRYLDLEGERSAELLPFLPHLANDESAELSPSATVGKDWPEWAVSLVVLLRDLGWDPIMQAAQRAVFDERYWRPAVAMAEGMRLQTALAMLVVYDTTIQSGPGGVDRTRMLFPAVPPSRGGDEHVWVRQYIDARARWLASYPNPLVQRSVYRTEALKKIATEENWMLSAPLTVRGIKVA